MKRTKYFVWAALTLALGACNDDQEFYGESKRITIEAGFGGSSRVATNGLSSMFEKKDAIGVYVWTGSTVLPGESKGFVANNVTNTFDGKNWTATPQMLWKDAETPHYFLSVYPQTDILTTTTYTLDPADQEQSDLLVAMNFGTDNAGIVAQTNPVPLAFGHVMAKLRVNLKFTEEFSKKPKVELVTVVAKNKATIDWQTATATATGDVTGIEFPALSTAAQGYACSYESVMVPQDGFRSVAIVIGGETYTFNSSQQMQLKKGTITTLNLSVGLNSVKMDDISILDWTYGTSISGYLNNIDAQIAAINGSIDDLKAVDTELNGYISALQTTATELQSQIDATNTALAALESDLEGQITASEQKVLNELNTVKTTLEGQLATINSTIATLQAKDAELEQKIADLQKYVDGEIKATEDWASATFSTLEQYEATQTAISEINALIKSTQGSITALEEKLNKKIADDIAAAVAGVNADMAAKVTEITDAYTAAIQAAKEDITAAYTDAIQAAITASETSMKEWVNGVLADGYYTKAEIDGKIAALVTQVTEGDAALQEEIDALTAALAQAESDLTAAYKKAIEDAIAANNGNISEAIAEAVKAAQDNLQAQINAINSEIETIKERLDIIEADINTINQQITAIKASLGDLEAMDAELNGCIAALQTTATELKNKIDAANALIDNVKQEMGDEIDAVEQSLLTQLESLKTTLEGQLADVLEDIETLEAKDTELEGKIAALQTYLNEELAKYGTKDWANATFATLAQYEAVQTTLAGINTTLAGINTALTDLENRINAKIATDIQAAIAALPDYATQIATAVTELTSAYTAAIATAKSEIEAAYTAAIQTAIVNLETSMKAWVNEELAAGYYKKAEIDAKLAALAADAEKYTDEDELQAAIEAQQAALQTAISNLQTAYNAAIEAAIQDNNGVIDGKIDTAIQAAKAEFETSIATINGKITAIETRLAALEDDVEALKARIQSIRFLPEYSDGKVKIEPGMSAVELTFIVSPKEAAAAIAADAIAAEKVKAFIYHTQSRAVDATRLNVTGVIGDVDTGMLTVSVTPPAEAYWATGITANIYIQINDGNNDIISEMIPAFYFVPYVTFSAASEQTLDLEQRYEEYDECYLPYPGYGGDTGYIEYSVGNSNEWTKFTPESQPVAFGGDKGDLHLRGISPNGTLQAQIVFGNSNISVACSGDIRTLVNWENYATADTRSAIFRGLFKGCSVLKSAPELPATTLAPYCYYSMFEGCTSLTEAPELPATVLANQCYKSMFWGCTLLTEAPELPATDLAENCYGQMFAGCTNLAAAPELSATNLANDCYNGMFVSCTSLTSAPELPATILANDCYNGMFNYCINLASAPELPAENLATGCYAGMFMNCTSLTSAPELPTTTLAESCYYQMFIHCTNLNSVTMLATDISATNCLTDWLEDVADTGTFTKAAGMTAIPTNSVNGIPTGWTVKNVSSSGLNNFGFGGNLTPSDN